MTPRLVATMPCRKYNSKGRGNGTPRTHGMTRTRTYRALVEMKRRCRDTESTNYPRYGARGITYCAEWEKFEAFLADMGVCPDGLELDRIDNNGNYKPGNCRWLSEIDQQNNRRSNVIVEINGIRKTIAQWARLNGVRPRTAAQRIRAGWPPEIAVSRESDRGLRLYA